MRLSRLELAAVCLTAAVLGLLAGRAALPLTAGTLYRAETAGAAAPAPAAQSFVPDGPVDLNTATLPQLMSLPGVGQVRAQAILDYRAAHGPFSSPEELALVPGVGQGIVDLVAEHITVSPP